MDNKMLAFMPRYAVLKIMKSAARFKLTDEAIRLTLALCVESEKISTARNIRRR